MKSLSSKGGSAPTVQFLGESREIKEIMDKAKMLAPTMLNVIIHGETGTGKGLMARLIHEASLRRTMPYIEIDCGSIPEGLIESELFGFEKGAFTGAQSEKKGLFEEAQGGTVFLDEITNLNRRLQAKLLRVLQERKVQKLGSTRFIDLDIRIIAATNIPIHEVASDNRFRHDLFHRLNEFDIYLPPLRERKTDIRCLVDFFLTNSNSEFSKQIKEISNKAWKTLADYHWPGNIRELKNTIRKAVLLANSYIIEDFDFSPCLNDNNTARSVHTGSLKDMSKSAMEKTERQMITEALRKTNQNKSKAARLLGIDRMTLYAKIKALKIK